MLTTTLTFRQALMSLGISLLLILTAVFQNTNDDVVYYTDSGHAEFTSSVPLHSFTGESNHLTGMIDFREILSIFTLI